MSMIQSLTSLFQCQICKSTTPPSEDILHTVSSDNAVLIQSTFSVWRCAHCGTIQRSQVKEENLNITKHSFDTQKDSYFNQCVNRNTLKILSHKFNINRDDLFLAYGIRNNIFLKYLNKKINHFFGYDPYYPKYTDKEFIQKRTYDFVFMENIFGQFPEPETVLKEVHQLLKKGGLLCIQVPCADFIDLTRPQKYTLELHQPYHQFIYSQSALVGIAQKAGFRLIHQSNRSFADTLWPFVNWRFMREYIRCRSNTADDLFDPKGRLFTVLKHPHLIFFGLFGYFFNSKTYMTLYFKKKVDSHCPVCQSVNLNYVHKDTYETMDLLKCLDCGVVFLDIGTRSTQDFYKDTYYPKEPLTFEKIDCFTRVRDIRRIVKPGAKIFEIGCGHGILLRALDKEDYEVYGNEFSGPAVKYAENNLYLKVSNGNINHAAIDKNSFDLFLMYHVLEHIDQPLNTLNLIYQHLKPGGWLLVEVPNYNSLYSRWFGRQWFHLDLPRHIFHYDKTSLSHLLEKNGFVVKKTKSQYFLYDVFGNVLSTLNKLLKTQNVLNDKEVHLTFTLKDMLERTQLYRDYLSGSIAFPFLFLFYSIIFALFYILRIEGGTLTIYAQKA